MNVIEPLIHHSLYQLNEGINSLVQGQSNYPFNLETIEDVLCTYLPKQLLKILSRTMALELNVFRLKGKLKGSNAEKRFENFLECLHHRETAIEILQEYPVLARQITICLNNWVTSSLEFLHHLCDDWDEIQAIFFPEKKPGVIVSIDGNVADKHREGKSVLIIKFSSGLQVVYKPKSLAVDVHFQELLMWLNQKGSHPSFRTLKIIKRENYGWVEFVKAQTCTSKDEIRRFYQRQGGYLALLYALEATDFHYENLIAVGEHPILLDLEALFHQRLGNTDTTKAKHLAVDKFSNSVFSIGLLPYQTWLDDNSEGVDISGLGGAEGQLTPFAIPKWKGSQH